MRRELSLTPLAGATALAGLAFQSLFTARDLLPLVLPATLIPLALALACRSRALLLSLVLTSAFASISVLLLFRDQPGLALVASGLRDGWRTMLTTVPPLPARPELLVLPLLGTWLAAACGAEIALRGTGRLLVLAPSLGLLTLATLLAAGNSQPAAGLTSGYLICVGLFLMLTSGSSRAWLLGPLVLALAIGGAALVTPRLPLPAQAALRDQLTPPSPHRRIAISPLDRIAPWLLEPATELFTVAASQPRDLRLAAFDRFDGVSWTSSELSVPTAGRVPGPPPSTSDSVTVTLAQLPGVWLPAPDRPTSVTGTPIEVEPRSGILISTDQLRPGLRYQLQVSTPDPTPAALRAAVPAIDPGATSMPPSDSLATFRQLAQDATTGSSSPFQQAVKLETWLRDHNSLDPRALPGHSYPALQLFLTTTHRGTSEHFATAFAVLARTLGLPSRVLVGFRPGHESAGTWHVRSGDVLAWPEIEFTGIGWVPFYPTPDQPSSASDPSASLPAGASTARRELADQVLREADTPPPVAGSSAQPRHFPWPYLLLLPLTYLLAVLPPWWRLRARRRPPAAQLRSAWLRVHRTLRPLLPLSPGRTNLELAAAGAAMLGPVAGEPLRRLAIEMDRVVFGGCEPELTGPEIWACLGPVERAAAQRTGLLQRIIRSLRSSA